MEESSLNMKLTLKTPNQGCDDIQVDCDQEWCIAQLKQHLQQVYPSKPLTSTQKLIYLGKLLQDGEKLRDVFGEGGAHTLHIVCNAGTDNTTSTSHTSSSSTTTTTTNNNNTSSTPQTSSSPMPNTVPDAYASNSTTDGLRYRGQAGAPHAHMFNPYATAYPMAYAQPQQQQAQQQGGNQYHQLQSQLAQQYQVQMQQYYQQMLLWQQQQQQTMAGGGAGLTSFQWATNPWFAMMTQMSTRPPQQGTPIPPTTGAQPPVPQVPQVVEPAAIPQQVQAGVQVQQAPPIAAQNVAMNAGGAAIAGEEEGDVGGEGGGVGGGVGGVGGVGAPRERDWLDWLYTSLHAVMLLSIVYFYSSTSRFLLVTLLAFLLYLYQNGWFAPRRPQQPQPQPQPQPQEGRADDQNGDVADDDDEQNEETPQTPTDEQQTGDQSPPVEEVARPNPLRTLCIFVVSFVTSLIPTPPAMGQQ